MGGIDMLVNNAGIGMRTVNPRFLSEPQSFWEVSPAGFRDVEALSRVMAADLAGSSVSVNTLLPGGRGTLTGMVPQEAPDDVRPAFRTRP